MIKQETVLMVTPIALNLGDTDLEKKAGNILQGLNSAAVSLDGFNKDNAAIRIPEITDGEHTEIMNTVVAPIASMVRHSLDTIQTHIIPICDIFEKNIRDKCEYNNLTETICGMVGINYIPLNREIFSETFFPSEPDDKYGLANVEFNMESTNLGHLPKISDELLENIFSTAKLYPSVRPYFEDPASVKSVIEDFDSSNVCYSLFGEDSDRQTISLNRLPLRWNKLNKFIIALFFISTLYADDKPLPGLTGITLEEYRDKLEKLKRMLKTVLYNYRTASEKGYNKRIFVTGIENVKYSRSCSHNGLKDKFVLSGEICVIYDEASLDFFSSSDKLNFNECVLGYLYGIETNENVQGSFIENAEKLQSLYNVYSNNLITAFSIGQKDAIGGAINAAVNEIINTSYIEEVISQLEPNIQNYVSKFTVAMDKQGDWQSLLKTPSVFEKIISKELRLSSTVFAVWIANILEAPIAGEILNYNINNKCGCELEQRKQLTKSIVKVIINKLYN